MKTLLIAFMTLTSLSSYIGASKTQAAPEDFKGLSGVFVSAEQKTFSGQLRYLRTEVDDEEFRDPSTFNHYARITYTSYYQNPVDGSTVKYKGCWTHSGEDYKSRLIGHYLTALGEINDGTRRAGPGDNEGLCSIEMHSFGSSTLGLSFYRKYESDSFVSNIKEAPSIGCISSLRPILSEGALKATTLHPISRNFIGKMKRTNGKYHWGDWESGKISSSAFKKLETISERFGGSYYSIRFRFQTREHRRGQSAEEMDGYVLSAIPTEYFLHQENSFDSKSVKESSFKFSPSFNTFTFWFDTMLYNIPNTVLSLAQNALQSDGSSKGREFNFRMSNSTAMKKLYSSRHENLLILINRLSALSNALKLIQTYPKCEESDDGFGFNVEDVERILTAQIGSSLIQFGYMQINQ